MKKKDISKILRRKIESGWREYLPLKFPYSLLGLNRKDFMTTNDIENLLGLTLNTKEESGITDQYYTLDFTSMYNDLPMTVIVKFDYDFLHDRTPEEFCKEVLECSPDITYLVKDNKIYYIRFNCGYRNPKCIWNKETLSFPEKEPYWLYEDDEEHSRYDAFCIKDEYAELLLQKFINNKEFAWNMFSGNFCFSLISGNFGNSIKNDIFKDLSLLSSLCKTNYEEFFEDCVEVTFAIRYKENVDLFIRSLKKIILKHKINVSIL